MQLRIGAGSGAPKSTPEPLLSIRGLTVTAVGQGGRMQTIVQNLDLHVGRGETVGIVGESGSGKSLTVRAVTRLLPPGVRSVGEVSFAGLDLTRMPEREMVNIRGDRISLLMQDPFTMMNPLIRCGSHIAEMLKLRPEFRKFADRNLEVQRRLREVGIVDPDVALRLSFQLSGGMAQRVALASALARDPELLIADEPSTALDVTTQAEVMLLLKRLQGQRGMGLVLITHDLRLAFSMCDRVYVLYAGSVVETAPAHLLERDPLHPYTNGLLLSEPMVDRRMSRLIAIPGSVPRADEVSGECGFASRCSWAAAACRKGKPGLAAQGHESRATACVRIADIKSELQQQRAAAIAMSAAPDVLALSEDHVISVRNLSKEFPGHRGMVTALKGVSLYVRPGESIGLVGESGSGKTTLGRCVMGLQSASSGQVFVGGVDATDYASLSPGQRRKVRRTVQMVFQDPYSTLNPRHTIKSALFEALRVIGYRKGEAADRRIEELLSAVGLTVDYAAKKPSALSGGERQRVSIARALAVEPKVLVCDEPVSALDVSVQAQILNLFNSLQAKFGLSYIFITHDLAVVRQIANRLYVLYRGELVEEGQTERVMSAPAHSYTKRLLESVPGARQPKIM